MHCHYIDVIRTNCHQGDFLRLAKVYSGVTSIILFLIAGVISLTVSASNNVPYDRKIKPHSIDAIGVGAVDSVPYIQVNEFNGGVTGSLPSIGINGFALTPTYSSPLKRRDNIERYDDNAGDIGVLGVGWHLGLGHITVIPRELHDICGHFQSGAPEKVYFVDSSGKSTKFAREQIGLGLNPENTSNSFSVPGDIRIHRDSNASAPVVRVSKQRDLAYIDSSGRVLTRKSPDNNDWRNQEPVSTIPTSGPIYSCWGIRDASHPNVNWNAVLPNDGIARTDTANGKRFFEEYGWFDFVLMQPDGGKVYYTPTYESLNNAWLHLIGQKPATPNAVHFYPTKVVNANGTSYTIKYAQPEEVYSSSGEGGGDGTKGGGTKGDGSDGGIFDRKFRGTDGGFGGTFEGLGNICQSLNQYSNCIGTRYIKSVKIDNGSNPESLYFSYEEVGGGRPLLREVKDSRLNRLAYFNYQYQAFDGEYHLASYEDAASRVVTIGVEDLSIASAPKENGQDHPWIKWIRSPAGGTTNIIYQLINVPAAFYYSGSGRPVGLCDDPDTTNGDLPGTPSCDWAVLRSNSDQKRVRQLSHSGGNYVYHYQFLDSASKEYDLLLGIVTGGAPDSYLKITMTANGQQDIERVTHYVDYQSEQYNSYPRALSKIVGKPIFKRTTFHNGDNQNANSVIEEEWKWRSAPLEALGGEAPYQSQRPQLISTSAVVSKYAKRAYSTAQSTIPNGMINSPTSVTEYTYHWNDIQMLVESSTSYIKEQAVRSYVVREFGFEDNHINKTSTNDGAWTQYQLALPSYSKECFIESSNSVPTSCVVSASQRLGHVELAYERAIPGNQNYFLKHKYVAKDEVAGNLASHTNKLVQTLDYHTSGSDKGYLSASSNGSLTTLFSQYENGEATQITAPDGSVTTKSRDLIFGAVIDNIVDAGVASYSKHDLIGRPLESQSGSDSVINTSYPYVNKTIVTRNNIELSETVTDIWGRTIRVESAIEPGKVNKDRTEYTNLSVGQTAINTNDAKVVNYSDLAGRPTHIKYLNSSNLVLKEEFFTYGFETATGLNYTKHHVKTNSVPSVGYIASESNTVLFTDILGRNRKAIPCNGSGNSDCAELHIEVDYFEDDQNGFFGIPLSEARVVNQTGDNISTRKRWKDLAGNLFKEYNPEIGITLYNYNENNQLDHQWNTSVNSNMDNYYRYDAGGRLVGIDKPGNQTIFEAQFDSATDLLSWSRTFTGTGRERFVEESYAYDENNRLQSKVINIPTLLRKIENLRPRTLSEAPSTLNLRWEQEYSGNYKVHLTHQAYGTLVINAEEGVNQVSLTNTSLADNLQAKISAGHPNASQYQLWKNQLTSHGATPISLDNEYTWKVSGISNSFEPVPTSDSSRITSACNILEFSSRRGINEGPLIEWETANCDGLSTEVLARTIPGTGSVDLEPKCVMPPATGTFIRDGGVFSGLKQGPRRAHWMFNGYNFEDVELAMNPDPDRSPTWTGPKQCDPVERAEFQLKVYDSNRNVVTQSEPIIADWTNNLRSCQIRNFYVNNGYTGVGSGTPRVNWETINCNAEQHVELKISSLDTNQPIQCDLSGELFSANKSGEKDATIMKNRPTGCSDIKSALFEIEIRENESPTSSIIDSREPIVGYIDRNDCHISYFNVTDGDENNKPKINWKTKNCSNQNLVQIKYDAVQPGVSEDCQLRSIVFSEANLGNEVEASFMYTPYIVTNGKPVDPEGATPCDAMKSVDVWAEIIHPSGFPLIDKSAEVDLSYTGGLVSDPGTGSSCSITQFDVNNSAIAGRLPIVSWDTECDRAVQVLVMTTTTHNPPSSSCHVNRGVWDGNQRLPNGREVEFMVGGYGTSYNCPSVTTADFWIEMRDAEDNTQLIETSQVKEARFTPLPNVSSCQISQITTTDGVDGALPKVTWRTLNGAGCGNSNIDIKIKGATTDTHIPTSCREDGFVIKTATYGTNEPVSFMNNCPEMRNGVVWGEIYQDNILIRKTDFKAFNHDPNGTPASCGIEYFSVQNSSTIGMLPRVYWQTNCGNEVSVQVRTTTIDPANLSSECAAYRSLWDGSKSGNRTVDFMVGGYGPNHNCPRIRRAEFIIELWQNINGSQVKIDSRPTQIARFDPVRSPICKVAEFSINNSTGGLPTATWQLIGSGCGNSNVEAKLYWSSTDFSIPSSCQWSKKVLDESDGGAARIVTLSDMDGSSTCPTTNVDEASLWIEIKEGGKLIQRTSYFEARYQP